MIFKKLHTEAIEPVRSTAKSAGLDLFSSEKVEIMPLETKLINTGITFDLEHDEPDWFLGLYIRSSMALRGFVLGNGVGVIDQDYAGNEIKVIFHNISGKIQTIEAGEKIAQMVVHPHAACLAKGVTFKYDNRIGGFGSTDGQL